jgi:MerR family transcriptional regulator, heat shock protein HspR
MAGRYLKLADVMQRLQVNQEFLDRLEAEELIHPKRTLGEDVVISLEDVDRIRFIHILTDEMEVNLAGAEVILHMREEIVTMRRQFDDILEMLVTELRQRLKR